MSQTWPQRLNFPGSSVATPMPAVRLDRLRALAEESVANCRSVRATWRPWTDLPLVPEMLSTLRASGAIGFSCGRIDVAELLQAAGETSVTLTRPPVAGDGPARLAKLARQLDVAVICEHFAQIEPLALACAAADSRIAVLLNVDSGRHRLGVRPGPDLSDLLEGLSTLAGVSLNGLALEPAASSDRAGDLSYAEHRLTQLYLAAQRSFSRIGLSVKVVSLAQLRDLGEPGGASVEVRSPVTDRNDPGFAILSTVVGRPTRDVAVIDASATHLSGFRRSDVVSSEAHFHEIRDDGAVLFVCGTAQDLLIGDLVAIPVMTPCFPWATSVLLGEEGGWRLVETVRH